MGDYHAKTKKELLEFFETSEQGISDAEAKLRLEKYGKNIIEKRNKLVPFKIFFEQFKSFLIYILIIALVISFLIKNNLDGVVILGVILLNVSIGFFQQYKAEKAVYDLRKILVSSAIVIRDGKHQEIPSAELVPGDIIVVNPGKKINADCRIIESSNLQTNEAVLTGESMPVAKSSEKLSYDILIQDRTNMLYAGTQVVAGSGRAIVVDTGMNSEFGKIASKLQEIPDQKTPMQKRMDIFSKQIGLIILFFVLLVAFLGIFEHFGKIEMLMTAIALAVSAIPEGLPAVLAISFAISSVFMSRKNVLIKKLPAVESLGSVTVICSDKTGTITEEKLRVQKIFCNGKFYSVKGKEIYYDKKKVSLTKELKLLFKTGVLCNNARFEEAGDNYTFIGDSTEEALLRVAIDFDVDKKRLTEIEPRIKEFEFDSARKIMSILRNSDRNNVLYSKGAPEKIISKCSFEILNGRLIELTKERKSKLLISSALLEKDALRVLGFAYKQINKKSEAKEESLIFIGFMGMIDPPRKEVKGAIAQCKSAGICVKIITGDSALTATAIGKEIGITGQVLVQDDLVKMSDDELKKIVKEISIFARITPEQKLRVAKILQDIGETVAITGDGINDALALKSADVGIAMGKRGTDVARDVADVVLINDNFASIVEGVKQGRKTYDNIKNFTKYMLAINFDSILLVAFSLLMGMPLPLIPLQILWMNIITDSFPAMSLVFEEHKDVMKTKPRKEKSILEGIWKFLIIAGFVDFIASLAVYLIGINKELPIEEVRTMVLTTGILFELFFIYTCRSRKPLKETGFFSNKFLNYSVILSLLAHIVLLYTGLSALFGVSALSLNDWFFILPFSLSGLVIFEISKYIIKNGD